jgi:hydrogenase maturation protein HypF
MRPQRVDERVQRGGGDHACGETGQRHLLAPRFTTTRQAYIGGLADSTRGKLRLRAGVVCETLRPVIARERRRFRVKGVVQGVGFRPFVYGLAHRQGLGGFVLNDGDGVVIEAEGTATALDAFTVLLREEAPELARLESLSVEQLRPGGQGEFEIVLSTPTGSSALIPPDVASCDECLSELFDEADRRYRYPFVNCTRCGPRFTIVLSVPYDRANTTMAGFPMCADCRREYEDPADRRFHAEATCCSACGPQLSMPVEDTVAMLREGAILAVKGLGGYHLACDAANESVVARLRGRKVREAKPFAVLTAEPDGLAQISPEEDSLLRSPARPVVLLRRRVDAAIAPSVAPSTPWLGLMLPYTPLHHLLADGFRGPLVLTSGNVSDEPIVFEDDDARARLDRIADAFLTHDRPIHRRCEDSVVRAALPIRRSRGHAPESVPLPVPAERPLVAAGAELKNTFCVARGTDAFLSPHLGDLDSAAAYRAFATDLDLYLQMLGVEPEVVAYDLHPEYLATKWALEQEAELVGVQHHHAHGAACLAEHGEEGPALALVFDGTGFGTDGTLWGGELLRCDLASYDRLAHLEPVPLPGGEAAIREPWRVAAAHLERAGLPVRWQRWERVRESLKLNPTRSSGMGRLFDAVAAILGVRDTVSYEGQAAVELEQLAGVAPAEPYPWRFGATTELVTVSYLEIERGRPRAEIAARFHETVAAGAAQACAEAGEPRTVVLSGGTFQNLRLLDSTRRRLEALGFRVLSHRLVPPNDGGISYGQAAVAARRTALCA